MSVDQGYSLTEGNPAYGDLVEVPNAAMGRRLPALVFLPAGYGSDGGGRAWPVVYLLHGRCGDAEAMEEAGLRAMHNPGTGLAELATFFRTIIVAPVVGNTWYVDAPNRPEIRMAIYIGEELPAFVDAHYRTVADRAGRFLAGFSMGGYGAVSTLCRYPDRFSVAMSRGGAMDLAFGPRDLDWEDGAGTEVLGSYWGQEQLFHNLSCLTLVGRIRDRRDVGLVIEVGVEDFLLKTNRRFRAKLQEVGLPHVYAEMPGGHAWNREAILSMLSHLQTFRSTLGAIVDHP